MRAKSTREILGAHRQAKEEAEAPEPFSPDHRVYPQGWSWAHIERDSERRYRSVRDVERKQDWVWAVDNPAVARHMTKEARKAAHELYDHQQRSMGDYERIEEAARVDGGFQYLGESWEQARSRAIARHARRYVLAHPEASPARWAVFKCLFVVDQPTLEWVRLRARPKGAGFNAKGKPIRLNQREVITRIVWCCEALADCGAGLDAGYGPA